MLRSSGWSLRIIAVAFSLFMVAVVVMANTETLPSVFEFYRRLPFGDKLGHFVLMGGLCLAANLVLGAKTWKVLGYRLLIGTLLVWAVVSLEELSQLAISSRNFSLTDLLADYAGIFTADRIVVWRTRRAKN
jgi:VanZ family protein